MEKNDIEFLEQIDTECKAILEQKDLDESPFNPALDEAVAKRYFSKEIANQLLRAARGISVDESTRWLFEAVFEDFGFKRLDRQGDLKAGYDTLCKEIINFRKKCLNYWKKYNLLANKGK